MRENMQNGVVVRTQTREELTQSLHKDYRTTYRL